MDLLPLGHCDLHVSAIGLGCVTFGREIDRDTAWQIMDRAIVSGITLFDTAETYGNGASETILGEWLASQGAAQRPVIATKVHLPLTAAHLEQAVTQSLRRLRVEQIDLLQLHGWDEATALEETCAALASLQQRGLVSHVGCSNFTKAQLQRTLAIQHREGNAAMASIQPRYNLVSREIEEDLLPFTEQAGVGVLAYSPLGAGFLCGKYQPNQPPPTGTRFDVVPGHRAQYLTEASFRAVERWRGLAGRVGVPMAELALAWVMRQRAVTSTLIGARNVDQVDQAVRAYRLQLDTAVWSELDELRADPSYPSNPALAS